MSVQSPGRSRLIELIASAAANATDPEHFETYNHESSSYRVARLQDVAGVTETTLESLGRELAAYFGWDFNGYIHIRKSPTSHGSFQFRALTKQLIARAHVMGAESALAAYEEVFEFNHSEIQEVVAIWGLHPRQRFEIRNGIYLEPLDSVAPSPPRDILLGISSRASFADEGGGFQVRARPKAALTHTFSFGPVFSPKREFDDNIDYKPRTEEMLEIARCLTLISTRKVEQIGSWFQADLERPIVGGVGGWGGQAINWGHQFEIPPENLDVERLRTIVSAYFHLPASDRERIRIIIGRLNSAKSDDELTDRAIDLGICLEALLFNPKDPTTEISFKFKMRGSILATNDPQERKAVFSLLDRIYSNRSSAAHGAIFRQESSGEIRKDLDAGTELASRLIQRVLELGRIPQSWNGLILGWQNFALS